MIYIFRSAQVTRRWRTIGHRRRADTTVVHHAERIYQSGSSLLPLEISAIKNEKWSQIKGHVIVINHTTATKKEGHFINTKYRVLRSYALPSQMSNSILVTQPKVWTNKDSFSTRLRDVTVLHRYTHLSPVGHYDYATSVGVSVPRQTCLFNSARE